MSEPKKRGPAPGTNAGKLTVGQYELRIRTLLNERDAAVAAKAATVRAAGEQMRRSEEMRNRQVSIINRLSAKQGWTYDQELQHLNEELSDLTVTVEEVTAELRAAVAAADPTGRNV